MRQLVLPGEKIKDGVFFSDSTYVENGKTYAAVLGFVENGRYTPLVGSYRPKKGDSIVGIVVDIKGTVGYLVDINTSLLAFLPAMATVTPLKLGNIISAKIQEVGAGGEIILGDVKKLPKGKIIEFNVKRIPRLIGRNCSMLNTLIKGTGNNIIVGANGYVYLSGGNIPLALSLIRLVEKKAHKYGLTSEVEQLIKEAKAAEKQG